MDWHGLAKGGIIYMIVAMFFHSVGAMVDLPYYMDPMSLSLWNPAMMPNGGAPQLNFYVLSAIISFLTGVIYAALFLALHKTFHEKDTVQTGLKFGIFLFMVAYVPAALSICLLFAVPLGLQLSWAVQGLIVPLAAGVVFAKYLG